MKVKMNQNLARVSDHLTQGQEYDLDDAEATRLIEAGVAMDPSGNVTRKQEPAAPANPAARQTLDRVPGTPLEKLPSSLNMPGHPYKDPASTTLTTDRLAAGASAPAAPAAVVATNAPNPAGPAKK